MKITCPSCHAPFHLDAGTNDADAHRFVSLMAGIPPEVGKAMVAYLGLFRSPKTGALAWSKVYNLAKALDMPIRDQRLTMNRRTYVATHALWAEAMHHLASRPHSLTLPLKSHNYMFSVLAGLSEKLTNHAEAVAEKKKHDQLRNRGKDEVKKQTTGTGFPPELKSLLKEGKKDDSRAEATNQTQSPEGTGGHGASRSKGTDQTNTLAP